MYVIKVYKVKNIKGLSPLKTWDLEYIATLPYIFSHKSENICNQLNAMFKDDCQHVISVQ